MPVFIPDEVADKHYNGFSNSILWYDCHILYICCQLTYMMNASINRPLFHYHPGEIDFDEDYWEAYQEANEAFADALEEIVENGDLIWVHDYHLMLLPALLRARLEGTGKDVKIGFFLHTPFPSSEIYRILPVRKQVLLGVLHADVIML